MDLLSARSKATMANGDEHIVVWDQRELAALEMMEFPPAAAHTQARYLVYHALSRTRVYTESWEKFGVDCKQVEHIDGSLLEGNPNPGRPGPDGESSSTSPTDPGSR